MKSNPIPFTPYDQPKLQPGDCLLYRPTGVFGAIISVKTWTRISHVEIYTGQGVSVASRDGVGVNRYALRSAELAYVRRPLGTLDLAAAEEWFKTVRGQGYDWVGLMCFTLAVAQGSKDKMFCSEFVTRWYRASRFDAVNPDADADHVAPAQFYQTPALHTVWSDTVGWVENKNAPLESSGAQIRPV